MGADKILRGLNRSPPPTANAVLETEKRRKGHCFRHNRDNRAKRVEM